MLFLSLGPPNLSTVNQAGRFKPLGAETNNQSENYHETGARAGDSKSAVIRSDGAGGQAHLHRASHNGHTGMWTVFHICPNRFLLFLCRT